VRWCFSLVVVLVACGCSSPPPTPPLPVVLPEVPRLEVAQVLRISGTVTLTRGADTRPVVPPVSLSEGDVVETSASGSALLGDAAGRQLELGDSTSFRVGHTLATLELTEGELTFLFDGGGSWAGASLQTPLGQATLSEGTAGTVKLRKASFFASVSEGTIELVEVDGGIKKAERGVTLSLSEGNVEAVQPVVAQPGPARLVAQAGRVLIKKPGEKNFKPHAGDEPLAPGTAILVPAGARGRLEVDHVAVQLPAGTTGVFVGAQVNGLGSTLTTTLNGPMQVTFSGGGTGALDAAGLRISAAEAASVGVNAKGKKRSVEVRLGRAQVSQGDSTKTIGPGESVLVDSNGVAEGPAARPALTVGASRVVRVFGDAPSIGLAVGAGKEVAIGPTPESVTFKGQAGAVVPLPALPKGAWYWKTADDSGRVEFAPDTASQRDGTAHSDTVAETGQKASIFFQSKVPALTFTFLPVEGALKYRFRLYSAGDLKTALVDRSLKETKVVVEPGVLGEGDFLWSATPLDGAGTEKVGGRMNKLAVVYDNARTSLFIEKPQNGERIVGALVAAGVAPLRSSLFINGKAVKPDERGRFSVNLGAVEEAVFRVNTDNSESYWVRRVRR
jgi:hypothetical protein